LTHAGIWLGVAGSGHLAVYLPDAHDLAGTMALLDTRSGRPVASGSVSGPPTSADATTGRIYVSVGERLRAQTVTGSQSSGPTTWIGTGSTAIATDPQHRLVAFKSAHGVTVASARTLHSLATFPLNSVTALAFTPDGSTLQAAGRYGLVTMNVARCTG
jgi:hypothetical protein